MGYPAYRPRRLRRNEKLRGLIQETELSVRHLVYPLFVKEAREERVSIPSMPDVFQFSIDGLLNEMDEVVDLGIPAVLLFGIPEKKDEVGSGAYDDDGIVQKAIRAIKQRFGDRVLVIADLCMCEYTSHGHCGVLKGGDVDNDATLRLLAAAGLSQARAGADVIAPSDMMDGRIAAIRQALDREEFLNVPILAYSAKYASGFYGPFRDAAESTPSFGDRRAYQMDPANVREAVKEILSDVEEGADLVMVKPAMTYLDVVRAAKEATNVPVAAYNVSGEYAMVKAAAANGWIDGPRVTLEILTSIRRAGADLILTYHAKEASEWLG